MTRTEMPSLVFAGTTVVAGTGKTVVFATGMDSEFGKITHLTQSVGEELSPFQKEKEKQMATTDGEGFWLYVIERKR